MLPLFIVAKIRERESQKRTDQQEQLQIDRVPYPTQARQPVTEAPRGVAVIDL